MPTKYDNLMKLLFKHEISTEKTIPYAMMGLS